ncbi:sulfatase, partial [Staphylococcus aureus]|nr:sulfatase [Staphylococcus aureus]
RLMEIKMNESYDVDELGKLSVGTPFNFSKGVQGLRIPAREKYKGVNRFGHLLFDLRDDPQQQHPIHDEAIEARMINLLIRLMKENDAPAEQYRRLGLDVV